MSEILLVRPISDKALNIIPNLGLGYLAAALRKDNEVDYLDCVKERVEYDGFEFLVDLSGYDYIGIQVFSCDVSSVLRMANIIKQNCKAKVVVGGPHISGKPDFVLNEDIDFGFQGEAEIGFMYLVKGMPLNSIPGLIYKEGKELKINPPQFLETFDMPAWDLIRPDTYPDVPHGSFVKTPPSCPIIITRGCPFSCSYCAGKKSTGSKLRKRSVESVMKEIKLLYNDFGIREIHIEDDNFTLDKEFAKGVCKAIIDSGLKISFACPNGVRLETLDEELLKLMEKAGFYSFAVGIESGNNRILKKMGRNVTKEIIKEKIELIAKTTKIRITGFCMIGFVSETIEEMKETAKFTRDLPIHRVQYGNFIPLPGTPIYDELVANKEIDSEKMDYDNYLDNHIVYSPKGVTPEELKEQISKSFRQFYFRPKIIVGLISEIKNWKQFKMLVRRGWESFF